MVIVYIIQFHGPYYYLLSALLDDQYGRKYMISAIFTWWLSNAGWLAIIYRRRRDAANIFVMTFEALAYVAIYYW